VTTLALSQPGFPRLPRVDRELARQLVRYSLVGGLGTVLSALLYLLFRTWWDAVPANLAALVLSTVASTEANRRFTFGAAAGDRTREYLQNAATVAFYALYSTVVLVLLGAVVDDPTALEESVAVAAASAVGGTVRFLVLRNWVFGPRQASRGVAADRPATAAALTLEPCRSPSPPRRSSNAGPSRSRTGSRRTARRRGRWRPGGTG
jgi:putative flippase GtrA